MRHQLPLPESYVCVARAEGRVRGTNDVAPFVFDTSQTISPVLAMRWLHRQALRLAERVDPDPSSVGWAPPGAFRPYVSGGDPAGELRWWAAYFMPHGEAQELLKAGVPLTAVVEDSVAGCRYVLFTQSLQAPAVSLPPEPPPWSQESCRRRHDSSPSDQGGPNHRGKHRRARLFV